MSDVSAEKARVVFLFVCGDRNLARALWLKVLIFDTLCRCAFRVWCVCVWGGGAVEIKKIKKRKSGTWAGASFARAPRPF